MAEQLQQPINNTNFMKIQQHAFHKSVVPNNEAKLVENYSANYSNRNENNAPIADEEPLSVSNINPRVLECEYAVRGPIVSRAQELETQLKVNPGSLPFDEVVYCNIGNPQSLGQKPITFFREVLSLTDHPELLQKEGIEKMFSKTALNRAIEVLAGIPGGTGAYSHSQGHLALRATVAEGIRQRDGHSASPLDIFLTDGASPAVHHVLQLLLRADTDGARDAVLCPVPQYPLYSAAIALHGGTLVPYFLQEDQGWGCPLEELERALLAAQQGGARVRALCVINPGNPTGQVLALHDQQAMVRFCVKHGLVLLADEVYQDNVYSEHAHFTAFKKVARDMGVGPDSLALVSFHSISKGFYGECGHRGGYMEVTGFPEAVKAQLYKVASVNLCSNTAGQVLMAAVMNPPRLEEDAHALFAQQRAHILTTLARKAQMLVSAFNRMEGVSCTSTEGAMYVFPRLHLPKRAVSMAQAQGEAPDAMYARRLLEETGVVVVPGSGFGQVEGTWHIRCTILPPEEKLPAMIQHMADFHARFMDEFRD